MKFRELSLTQVSGALPRALGNPRTPELERAGLVLRLTDTEGNVGLGEASPLPGFSAESLEACRLALEALSLGALEACFAAPGSLLARLERARALLPNGLPAAQFSLETALLDLTCARTRRSPFELFERPALARVELNAVLDATLPEAYESALELLGRGYTTLKLKLGTAWEQALDTLIRLTEHSGLKLRVDANRGLGTLDLPRVLPRLAELTLEFLEEPCAPALWASLPATRPRLALDESLLGVTPDTLPSLLRAANAQVIVLKPMALGGFSECLRWAAAARALGSEVVVTHLFDGPIALRAAAVLALLVHSPMLAAGLAPHAGLAIWPDAPSVTRTCSQIEPECFSGGISPANYWQELGG